MSDSPERVAIDTNVLLDVLLAREPWLTDAIRIWSLSEGRVIEGCIPASSLTDIYYLARRAKGAAIARAAVGVCVETFAVLPVGLEAIRAALSTGRDDFEDEVMLAVAESMGCTGVVTRDRSIAHDRLGIWSPAAFLAREPYSASS